MNDVGVIIGTYGDVDLWRPWVDRAVDSINAQTRAVDDWCWVHADSLHVARNLGAQLQRDREWLIFLDADDELDPGYVEAMLAASGDIRRPATLGVYPDGTTDDAPVMIPGRPLSDANFIVIGAMCSTRRFVDVGGFHDHPILEDWCLWRRMVDAGAEVCDVPDAIYRVGVRAGSRNSDVKLHGRVYAEIRGGCR